MQVCRERNLKGTGLSAWLFDSHTGEILDKKVPDKVTSNSSDGQSYDEDAVFDALKEACPVDYATGENLKIKKSSDGASYEVSFNTSDGEFFYNFDKETLEVLEKESLRPSRIKIRPVRNQRILWKQLSRNVVSMLIQIPGK